MTILQRRDAPSNGYAVIGRALDDLSFDPGPLAGGAEVNIYAPLPLYGVEFDVIKDRTFLKEARLTGWCYLIGADKPTAYAELRSEKNITQFVSLIGYEIASKLMDAAHQADDFARSKPGNCEVRIIEIPTLKISALWLTFSPKSVFIPYLTAVQIDMPGPVIEEDAFVDYVIKRRDDSLSSHRDDDFKGMAGQ